MFLKFNDALTLLTVRHSTRISHVCDGTGSSCRYIWTIAASLCVINSGFCTDRNLTTVKRYKK